MPRLLHHISARYPFLWRREVLWAKNGKYEYCHYFSTVSYTHLTLPTT